MGKAALFAIVAFTLIGGYYSLSAQRGIVETTDRLGGHQLEVLARNAALTGYTQARQRIADAVGFSVPQFSGTFQGAEYTVTVTPQSGGQFGLVKSAGSITDGAGRTRQFNVEARIEREQVFEIHEEPPVFMRYGLIVDSDLTLNGNVLVDTILVEGAESSQFNANIHTNGKLSVKGGAATIRGFGTYVTNRDVNHQSRVFSPYYNPTNEPVVTKTEPVAIPTTSFDIADVAASLGPNESYSGNHSLSGTVDYAALGATRENPYVVHVKGDLTATGGTTISGYVIYLVEGDITFQGNIQMGRHEGPAESNFAFYSGRDITVGGSAKALWGQMFAKRDVKFHGTPNIYGNIVVGGEAQISGTPKIYYTPASAALTTMFQDPEIRLTLVSYNEW
jgi:hypothetical protein